MRESDPVIDAKALFAGIIKKCKPDCILDVGSRDGDQSLFFRDLAPEAYVAAFEANPANYRAMLSRNLERCRIEVYPYAATNSNGVATFYVADPACDPQALGASSLLPGAYALKEKIEVETRRLDDFILEHYPDVKRIALWVDVECAEYQVLEGISKIKDRVIAVHTETSLKPVRENQKTFAQLTELLKSWGFIFCGSTIQKHYTGGDVVYLNAKIKSDMGISYRFCFLRAFVYRFFPFGKCAVYLRRQFPPLYRFLRGIYIRFAT